MEMNNTLSRRSKWRVEVAGMIANRAMASSLVLRAWPLAVTAMLVAGGIVSMRWLNVDWAAVASLGYGGLFLVNLIGSATVAIPMPGVVSVFLAGQILDPVLVGFCAGAGSALGEISGYLVGRSGRSVLARSDSRSHIAERVEAWMTRHGFLTVLGCAFIPNPLFDVAGVAAGTARMDVKLFLIAAFIGKTARLVLVALAGYHALDGLPF
jgi:membrane protein DedA with SNARE-associated domain